MIHRETSISNINFGGLNISMDEITFKKTHINSLYLTEQDNASGWRGFLSRETIVDDELSVETTLGNYGVYFFASYKPKSLRNFSETLTKYIKNIDFRSKDRLFLWLIDPDSDAFYDDGDVTHKEPNTLRLHMREYPHTHESELIQDFTCIIGNYISFSIPSGSLVGIDKCFRFISFKATEAELPIRFYRSDSTPHPYVYDNIVYIPFGGPDIGSFRFKFNVNEQKFYNDFEVNLRYFYDSKGVQKPTALNYPIFHSPKNDRVLTFEASIDPVSLWNEYFPYKPWRTYLAFNNREIPIDSYYRTQYGIEVQLNPLVKFKTNSMNLPYLNPLEESATLVFSPQNTDRIDSAEPMYLVPKGAFHIVIQEPSLDKEPSMLVQLLCGISGTETITCVPKSLTYDGDVLYFRPLMPAYTSSYSTKREWSQDDQLLTRQYTTSWMTVKRLSNLNNSEFLKISYLTQPEDQSLFQPVRELQKISPLYQPSLLDMTSPNFNIYVPFIPISGVKCEISDVSILFEQSILMKVRKQIMDKQVNKKEMVKKESEKESLTPQGLILKEVGNNWTELLLAQNILDNQPVSLQINNVSLDLKKSLLTSQLFLVISSSDNLGELKKHISIAEWPFYIDLSSNSDTERQSILIFKACKGTLREIIANPKMWTNPEAFNQHRDLEELSSWMIKHCTKDINQDNKNAQKFLSILDNPKWNGIIVLNIGIQFPKDLKGLLGGIKSTNFYAHHLAIETNRVTQQDRKLIMDEVSSMHAYINYEDPPAVDEDYEFKVEKLEVLFDNSKITAFNALTHLKIDKLFGNNISSLNKVMKFEGKYHEIEGSPTYSFYSINPVELDINNKILDRVSLTKATFSMEQETLDCIESQFLFWGNLQFNPNNELVKYFSYGGTGSALFFSNLGIRMSLPNSFRQKDATQIYTFNPQKILLDNGLSKPQSKSIVAGFPLQLSNFRSNFNLESLMASGYKKITINGQNISDSQPDNIPEEWYGLEFNLDLGCLGNLSTTNSLRTEFIICWSNNDKSFLGIRVPELPLDRIKFSLEQALETSIGNGLHIDENNGVFRLILEPFTQQFLGQPVKPTDNQDKIIVFTDPKDPNVRSNLGWYTAFKN